MFLNGSVTCVLGYFQVIKYKLCRCVKKKHKGRNNNDRGAVLSLDDVKHHVSRLLLSTSPVSDSISFDRDTLGVKEDDRAAVMVVGEESRERDGRNQGLGRQGREGKCDWEKRERKLIGESGVHLIKAAGHDQQGQARIRALEGVTAHSSVNEVHFNCRSDIRQRKKGKDVLIF